MIVNHAQNCYFSGMSPLLRLPLVLANPSAAEEIQALNPRHHVLVAKGLPVHVPAASCPCCTSRDKICEEISALYLNWARGTLPALTGLVILTPEPERLKTMLAGDVVTAARWEVSVWLQTPGKTPALPD
jgi:hypothetical protein